MAESMTARAGSMAHEDTTISTLLDDLVEEIGSGRVAVLCGAGISWLSGLPTAGELIRAVLEGLGVSDLERLIGPNDELPCPFELYLENLRENGVDFVAEVFRTGEPNPNHRLLAALARAGLVETIVTTNFDRLLETALRDARVEYGCVYREAELEHFSSAKGCRVVKLHGSVDEPAEMAATIRQVAARRGMDARRAVVEHLFSTGPHDTVLILGYRCADVFDIVPQIENLAASPKKIVLVEHSRRAPSIEAIDERVEQNPFRGFRSGFRLGYDTDALVDHLWFWLGESPPPPVRKRASTDFRRTIANALSSHSAPEILKHYYPGQMLFCLGEHESAQRYFHSALEAAQGAKNVALELGASTMLAGVNIRTGDFAAAHERLQRIGEALPESLRSTNLAFQMLVNEGDLHEARGDAPAAARCFAKAIEMAPAPPDRRTAAVSQKLGVAFIRLGRLKEGAELIGGAGRMAAYLGMKDLEQLCLGGIGCACKDTGQPDAAKKYLTLARNIAHDLGDRKNESDWIGNLGSVHQNEGDHERALELYEEALELARRLGDKPNQSNWLSNMGISYKAQQNYEKAIACYQRAIETDRAIGDQRGLGISLNNLGNVWKLLGRNEAARECLEEALGIALATGDPISTALRRFNLAGILEEAGELAVALEYYRQAHGELLAVVGPEHPFTCQAAEGLRRLRDRAALSQRARR